MSEAPEQAQLNVPDRYYWWSNGRMQIRPCDVDNHYSIEYVRADIAEAEKQAAVREVLENLREELMQVGTEYLEKFRAAKSGSSSHHVQGSRAGTINRVIHIVDQLLNEATQ